MFVKDSHLCQIIASETNHLFDQCIINPIAERYMPELEDDIKILMTESMFYITYPDSLNEMLGSCELKPLSICIISHAYSDDEMPEDEFMRGLFPKPRDVFIDIKPRQNERYMDSQTNIKRTQKDTTSVSDVFKTVESYIADGGIQGIFQFLVQDKSDISVISSYSI